MDVGQLIKDTSDISESEVTEVVSFMSNVSEVKVVHLSSAAEEIINVTEGSKFLKEEFVSYTTGTIPMEIFLMALFTLSCYAFFVVFKLLLRNNHLESYCQKCAFIVENILITLPILLASTLLSNHLVLLNVLSNGVVLSMVYFLCRANPIKFLTRLRNCKYSDMKLNYVTNYKANIQLTTAICILAVDFHVFPRRFAKAEVYGVGMMDMGVGTIVFSHALTSRQARLQENVSMECILSSVKGSAFLVVLGLLRTLLTKEFDYQEHVVEYGKNWNFFFTLAMMKPVANTVLLILNCSSKQPLYLCLSFISIVAYQISLSKYGLEGVIQDGFVGDKTRTNFIDANREGIFSCIGYLSLYFCGLFFGKQMYKKSHSLCNKLYWLACWFLAGYASMSLCIVNVSPISRQMANMGYILIQIAFNSLLLFGFLLIDMVCHSLQIVLFRRKQERIVVLDETPASFLAQAISTNLLIYFLLANVLTGFVNIIFDTLKCSTIKSMGILVCYIGIMNNIIWTVSVIQKQYGSRKISKD